MVERAAAVPAQATGRVRLAVSLGDPAGIGPEVTALALADPRVVLAVEPWLFGDTLAFEEACALRGLPAPVQLLAAAGGRLVPQSALPAASRSHGGEADQGRGAGRAALAAVDAAIDAVRAGEVSGLCTAPLSKQRVALASPGFQGHTEHLAQRFGAETVMMLAGPRLRVALLTNHLAISRVPQAVQRGGLLRVLRLVDRELRERFGIARPRLAVLGLNPHAGDGGLFGDEEAREISPALAEARALGIDASGPHPADGFFPKALAGACDAVVALYHDQGLIAAKLVDFRETVNVTLGLPAPRTSPDHGTAFDIAGRGVADAEPMVSALLLCARLAGRFRAGG